MALRWYVRQIVVTGTTNRLFLDRSRNAADIAEAGTTVGWNVGQVAAGNFQIMAQGVEQSRNNFTTTAAPDNTFPATADTTYAATAIFTPPSLYVVNSSIGTFYPMVGLFPAGTWTFTFGFRAVTNATGQDGRVNIRVFKSSANAANDVELTSAALVGTAVTNLATAATQFSTVTWTNAPEIRLNDEYLYVKIAWEITGAATNNNADVNFRFGNTCYVETTDFRERRYNVT